VRTAKASRYCQYGQWGKCTSRSESQAPSHGNGQRHKLGASCLFVQGWGNDTCFLVARRAAAKLPHSTLGEPLTAEALGVEAGGCSERAHYFLPEASEKGRIEDDLDDAVRVARCLRVGLAQRRDVGGSSRVPRSATGVERSAPFPWHRVHVVRRDAHPFLLLVLAPGPNSVVLARRGFLLWVVPRRGGLPSFLTRPLLHHCVCLCVCFKHHLSTTLCLHP
jgi:hypothetical protein